MIIRITKTRHTLIVTDYTVPSAPVIVATYRKKDLFDGGVTVDMDNVVLTAYNRITDNETPVTILYSTVTVPGVYASAVLLGDAVIAMVNSERIEVSIEATAYQMRLVNQYGEEETLLASFTKENVKHVEIIRQSESDGSSNIDEDYILLSADNLNGTQQKVIYLLDVVIPEDIETVDDLAEYMLATLKQRGEADDHYVDYSGAIEEDLTSQLVIPANPNRKTWSVQSVNVDTPDIRIYVNYGADATIENDSNMLREGDIIGSDDFKTKEAIYVIGPINAKYVAKEGV